jgi:hypothetical protein
MIKENTLPTLIEAQLIYKESILSGYGITNFTKGNFDIQAGLRAEYQLQCNLINLK